MSKLKTQASNINHVLLAAVIIFFIEQLAQIPIDQFKPHNNQNIVNAIIALILLGIALYWVYLFIHNNRELDTEHNFYNSVKVVCYNLAISLFLMQAWAYSAIKWFNLQTGGTTSNQQAITNMGHTTIGLMFEWILVVIAGPIIEEFLFRYAIIQPKYSHDDYQSPNDRKYSPNRIIRLIISILLFAFIHMLVQVLDIKTGAQFKAAIYGFGQYLIISIIFSLNYFFRNNIKENMIMHIAYNTIAILLTTV